MPGLFLINLGGIPEVIWVQNNFYRAPLEDLAACHGGEGVLKHLEVFSGKEFQAPVSFLNYTVLPPGASIGLHRHGNDQEVYVILDGVGEMTLDGEVCSAQAEDVFVNRPYGTHGLKNTGEADMPVLVFEVRIGE